MARCGFRCAPTWGGIRDERGVLERLEEADGGGENDYENEERERFLRGRKGSRVREKD
jgi:hypothetical protein